MNPRLRAVAVAGERSEFPKSTREVGTSAEHFASHVFNYTVMQEMLPQEIYDNVRRAMEGVEKIKPEYADPIAAAMKDWATNHGATHYTHWFQPLTGKSAEKHDSFIDWSTPGGVIEKFSGKQLLQGEPDASSLPSGGLRSTYEARGYTGWDPSSPAFIWTAGDGVTLFIPSVFFSWTGDVLDAKIPLLRSEHAVQSAAFRLLRLVGTKAGQVYSTLGLEQEYFVIDRALRNLRPDLTLLGHTVYGVVPAKGQELQDHYFGSVKDRILRFMREFETAAIKLGIPIKTRHNEVAPAQHEVAPIFEKASVATDHNIILMELMRQVAAKHDLTCLLHEKPFAGLNGSGKHTNWSLSTDTGLNLLDPTDSPGSSLPFLILLTAVISGVHRHSALLRASAASATNDSRLGGHEAPPAIISIYLGEDLEGILREIEMTGVSSKSKEKGKYDFGIPVIPELTGDHTDRNRTSPFAFTGNKFEFRMVGSAANAAIPATVINAIVAESLDEMLDKIEANLSSGKKGRLSAERLAAAAMPVIREFLKKSRKVCFSGDNYSSQWVKEAKRRKLPNIENSVEAFKALKVKSTVKVFRGILTEAELASRYEIANEIYASTVNIEANLLVDLFRTQILPAAMKYQEAVADSILARQQVKGLGEVPGQKKILKALSRDIEKAIKLATELEKLQHVANKLSVDLRAEACCNKVRAKGVELRAVVDDLETVVDDSLWPLPKYRELLFLV